MPAGYVRFGSSAVVILALVFLIPGCGEPVAGGTAALETGGMVVAGSRSKKPVTLAGGSLPAGGLVVTHGGVGSPPEWSSFCQRAAKSALIALTKNNSALQGAVVGTMTMENFPNLNAGTGANIRLDGKTIQMDAAVMTSDGEFASVAVIERVRNPVLVARAVMDTPHRMLAGEGATRFAHRAGFVDIVPRCSEAEAKYQKRIQRLLAGEAGGGFDDFDWRQYWNYPNPPPSARVTGPDASPPETGDTVGCVARNDEGQFAATLSTGGTSITLNGRVGDVPIYGCGCYAGPAGAVACTGFGEEIIRHTMAKTVYEFMARGLTARAAVMRGCELFGQEYSLGLIAVGHDGWGVAANRVMAYGQVAAATDD